METNCQNRVSGPATQQQTTFLPSYRLFRKAWHEWKVFVAFVDYLEAFNIVDRHSLWLCVSRKGLSRIILNLQKSMYENMLCCVRSGHDYTEFFESPAGVKQGCLLSPKLFCLFINEVADEIRTAGRHGILLSNLIEEIFLLH